MARPTESDIRLGAKILTWIGIINQLSATRITQALKPLRLPYPQFVLLIHFSHRPSEPQTVTGVASAMQQPQPGITKTIQKMIVKKLLRTSPAISAGVATCLFEVSGSVGSGRPVGGVREKAV